MILFYLSIIYVCFSQLASENVTEQHGEIPQNVTEGTAHKIPELGLLDLTTQREEMEIPAIPLEGMTMPKDEMTMPNDEMPTLDEDKTNLVDPESKDEDDGPITLPTVNIKSSSSSFGSSQDSKAVTFTSTSQMVFNTSINSDENGPQALGSKAAGLLQCDEITLVMMLALGTPVLRLASLCLID